MLPGSLLRMLGIEPSVFTGTSQSFDRQMEDKDRFIRMIKSTVDGASTLTQAALLGYQTGPQIAPQIMDYLSGGKSIHEQFTMAK